MTHMILSLGVQPLATRGSQFKNSEVVALIGDGATTVGWFMKL